MHGFKSAILAKTKNCQNGNLFDIRNLQEQVKKAFCYRRLNNFGNKIPLLFLLKGGKLQIFQNENKRPRRNLYPFLRSVSEGVHEKSLFNRS